MRQFQAEKQEKSKIKAEFNIQQEREHSMKKKMEAAETEWSNVQDLKEIDSRFQEIQDLYAWAMIRDSKKLYNVICADIDAKKKDIE